MEKINSHNILLIERHNFLRNSLAELLTLNDFKVTKAANTSRALQLIGKQLPDLIICARSFPDGNCSKVLLALRKSESTREIPFIFLSSKPAGCLHQMMLQQSRVITLIKPFTTEDLLAAVHESLEQHPWPPAAEEPQLAVH